MVIGDELVVSGFEDKLVKLEELSKDLGYLDITDFNVLNSKLESIGKMLNTFIQKVKE